MTTKRIVPTFLLKGLIPDKLHYDYHNGYFNRPIPTKEPIRLTKNITVLAPEYSNNNNDAVFMIKDKNNKNSIITTTGHEIYNIFMANGQQLPKGERCDICKCDFEHTRMICPTSYREDTIIKNGRLYSVYNFWGFGEFCSFNCSYAHVLKIPLNNDINATNYIQLLKFLYFLVYPDGPPLRPTQDIKLLKSNGGSLTEEQWADTKHVYVPTDRVRLYPVKMEYNMKENFY